MLYTGAKANNCQIISWHFDYFLLLYFKSFISMKINELE